MLLSVITLGIYSFWGRVAITKYLYSQTSFGKRAFDYHATGKEMFIGFLKGLGIIAVILAIFGILNLLMPSLQKALMGLFYIAIMLFAVPLLMVGKWHFWLNRSSWCNVRFNHTSEYPELRRIWIRGLLLTIITLGFYSPRFQNQLQKYFTEKAHFGNLAFNYTGSDSEYFWLWLKGVLLTIVTLGIYSFWYAANLNRYIMSHTTLNGRSFNSTMTGGGLFKTAFINILIVIFTLSFGFPIAVNRMYGYFFENLTLDARPEDLSTLAAAMDPGASALASGIEEAANVVEAISGII
jgi:uncharacterized membrane protein YjgN (DUF898 family)